MEKEKKLYSIALFIMQEEGTKTETANWDYDIDNIS